MMIEGQGSILTCKYKTRLERAARDKHFNLMPTFVNSDRKSQERDLRQSPYRSGKRGFRIAPFEFVPFKENFRDRIDHAW
jgi:hypothetical protein